MHDRATFGQALIQWFALSVGMIGAGMTADERTFLPRRGR
jgi:hypothetical protein